MRNMSFALTIPQILNRTKDVTRRVGWHYLKEGDRFWAVEKGMGLKAGQKVKKIALLECTSTELVELSTISKNEVIREGFPDMSPDEFVTMFCRSNNCHPYTFVNRIEFCYVGDN